MSEEEPENELDSIPVEEEYVPDEDIYYEDWRDSQALQYVATLNRAEKNVRQKKITEVV